jgi:hypothetical protein
MLAMASTAKFSGEQRSELQGPSPHRFVGDIQTAFSEQIFGVAIAERETHMEPNGVPENRRQKPMAGKRDRSCAILPIEWKRAIVAVTTPPRAWRWPSQTSLDRADVYKVAGFRSPGITAAG